MTSRHGSESFWIEGEGLLNTQMGGRSDASPTRSPRPNPPRPLPPTWRRARRRPSGSGESARKGRAGWTSDLAEKVARAMTRVVPDKEGDIPAGYTYLGQFIDHDLTMDVTEVELGEPVSPAELLQARSPSLDLDSLYARGPSRRTSAKFYDADGLHLKTGDTLRFGPDRVKRAHDLPRVGKGKVAQKRKALIPDPRNDENLIVAQTHLAMIRFHNRVVDKLPASMPAAQRFLEARKAVTLHYQWLIWNDYLPRIVQKSVLDDVFANGRKLVEPDAGPTDVPAMPMEFSVAGFRLGHSMVRPAYDWNRRFPDERRGPVLDVRVLRGRRHPRRRPSSWPATGSPTGGGCTTSRRAATPIWRPERREQGAAARHPRRRSPAVPARQRVRSSASRTWTSSTSSATWRSATSCAGRCSSSPAASRWSSGCRRAGCPSIR